MDAGWTLGGRYQKFWNGIVTEGGLDGHGMWTGWSRKVDGMVNYLKIPVDGMVNYLKIPVDGMVNLKIPLIN